MQRILQEVKTISKKIQEKESDIKEQEVKQRDKPDKTKLFCLIIRCKLSVNVPVK